MEAAIKEVADWTAHQLGERNMRTLLFTLAALLMTAGMAAAQVAAPSLNPTPTFNIDPWNVATFIWDGPSRLGISYGTIKYDDKTNRRSGRQGQRVGPPGHGRRRHGGWRPAHQQGEA